MREVLGFIAGMFEEDIRPTVQAQLSKVDEGFISPDIALHSKLVCDSSPRSDRRSLTRIGRLKDS